MQHLKDISTRALCYFMSLLITLQPNMVQAQQAVITVDPSTPSVRVETTINNTPLLQIVAPNASGVSHNKFTDFNVGSQGLVINNATTNTTTNIGGAILSNPNFSGTAASLILNEVTSANRSSLTGFTEIAGQKADYILANPNGITCNGCGFINTSRSTLTTGTPTFSGTALDSLSVSAGDIAIQSLGLNASEADAFDIITRAATLTGAINAKDLTLITGRNDVKYADRSVTAKADDASAKPTLAIDSSALGGMYANRIALIANETGVGVNMQGDMAADTSSLTITADGRIDFKKATAKTDLSVTSNTAVGVSERAYGSNNLAITAPTISATGATLAAANNVTLSGTTITGTNAQIIAGLQSDGTSAAQGNVAVTATGTFAYDGGTVRAGQNVSLSAAQINGGATSSGITSLGNTTISGTTSAALSGNLSVGGNLSVTGGALSTTSGTGDVTGTTTINGASYTGANALKSGGNIAVTTTGDTAIQTGGSLTSNGTVSVNAQNITSDGTLSGQTGTTLTATQALTTTSNAKTQSGTDTTLTSTGDMTLGGTTTATNALTITAPNLTNNGTIADGTSDGATLNITANLTNTGLIYASGDMKLIVPLTLKNDEGQILAGGSIQIDKDGAGAKNTKVWNYSGNIESLNGGITIATGELLNERKNLVETNTVVSSSGGFSNGGTAYLMASTGPSHNGDTTLTYYTYHNYSSNTVTNYSASSNKPIPKIISNNDMLLTGDSITNKSGQILSNANLTLSGTTLNNTGYTSATVSSSSTTTPIQKITLDGADNNVYGIGGYTTSSSSSSTVTDPGDTFITAGGNITGSFTDKIDNISIKKGVAPVSITQGSANVFATSATIGTPTTASINSGLTLPTGVGGLFVQRTDPTSKYILETNPAVSTLGALYGSSYFESKMGVNLAAEVKRLGNDDYETRLVRDQILATTHKRFLSTSITSDTDQYKALMDNALAQHTGLKLSYGVELTSAQVAALATDIVWMVEVTLADGRKALKPVVYFAEATRMNIDSSGALIVAGGELKLTAANDITNSGTLSGAKTTLASTSGSITNSYGKLAATNGDLSVTADQNISNTGGLITGQNVALTATNGNFTNTTETWRQSQTIQKNYQGVWGNDKAIAYNDTTGAKARITATGGNLSITSGKDIKDSGATSISATGDASLKAGGNVNLQALTTQTRGLDRERTYESTRTVTQTGANVSAGGNLAITSSAQTTLHGTKAEAGGDLSISSGTDTVIAATQTTKVVERGDGGFGEVWSTEVKNDLASLKAGNDVKIASGLDTVANGIVVTASNDVNISSLASTSITSVQDSFEQNIKSKKYTLIVDKKDTVRSKITAGNDVNITATLGDVTLKAAEVTAGKKVTLAALNGDVNLSANKDVDFRHEVKTTEGGLWTTFSDQGRLDEKVVHTKIDAGDGLTISVGTNGTVNVDYKDFGDLNKSVERLSKEPGLEWMAQVKASATPAQWNAIKEAHKSWDYKSQSLSPQAAMIITMVATIATMGAGAIFGTAAQAGMSLGGMATQGITNATLQAAIAAGINSLAISATVSTFANKGNLGATLKDLASKDSLRSLATAMVTAGVLQGISGVDGFDLDYESTLLAERIKVAAVELSVKTAVQSTVGGQDLGDTLKYNLITAGTQVASAELSEQVGIAFHTDKIGDAARYIAHAAIGCGAGAATGGDCAGGAAGAVVAEVMSDAFLKEAAITLNDPENNFSPQERSDFINQITQRSLVLAQVSGGLASFATSGKTTGAETGLIAAKENSLKVITLIGKSAWKISKKLIKKGKIGIDDIKEMGVDEILGMIDDVRTLTDGEFNEDDIFAIISLAVGVDKGDFKAAVEFAKKIKAVEPTRFIDGVKVVDIKTGKVFTGTIDLKPTLDRITSGIKYPHRNDGSIFKNNEKLLPSKPQGYYTEYVNPTPGINGPGPQRIIVGKGGEKYYSPDHYGTFIPIN